MEFQELLEQANEVYKVHHPPTTNFERSIFTTWTCKINDCSYCYMSTQPASDKGKRSFASILAEVYLTKKLGWDLGFLTGGIGVWKEQEMIDLVKYSSIIAQEPVLLNLGPLPKATLQKMQPYLKGVALAIEVLDKELHEKTCPSKKLEPFFKMARDAKELNLYLMTTLILGLGEDKSEYENVKQFFKEYKIDKIQYCLLKPQKNTPFELSHVPDRNYHAWWVARTRVDFPEMNIKTAIIKERIDTIPLLLKAGANTLSRFPALKMFGTKRAQEFENEIKKSERTMTGSLTKLPNINPEEINNLELPEELKPQIIEKVQIYLKRIKKNQSINTISTC